LENLKEVCNKYDLSKSSVQLVVDDGPENNGCVNEFLSIPGIQLKKLIAQLDIRQSNSMIEAANKRIKYDYLFTKELLDFHAAKTYLFISSLLRILLIQDFFGFSKFRFDRSKKSNIFLIMACEC
jgi:hypothetical protein